MQSDETTVRRVPRYDIDHVDEIFGDGSYIRVERIEQHPGWNPADPEEWCRAEDVARLEDDYAEAVEIIRRAELYVYNSPYEGTIPMSNAMRAVLVKAEGREES